MKTLVAVIVVAVTMAAGPAGAGTAAPRVRIVGSSYATNPCPAEIAAVPRVTCGTLTVRGGTPGAQPRRLAVATVHAAGPTVRPDPILFLHGGPGGEGVRQAVRFETSGLAGDRDVVLVDQSGGGLSTPLLSCPELERLDWYGWLKNPSIAPAALRTQRKARAQCQRRLDRDGAATRELSSRTIANDISGLRTAMDIKQWNLVGYSYGARIALAMLRDHPEGIRSMLLDAPLAPDANLYDPSRPRSALTQLFARCTASPACAQRHPDLEREWVTQLRRLERHPEPVAVPETADHPATTVAVDGPRIILPVVGSLADRALAPVTPDLMVGPGAVTRAAEIAASGAVYRGPIGAEFAVVCREDQPFRTPVRPNTLTGSLPANWDFWHECEGWRARPAHRAERAFPHRRVPTVVFHTDLDPVVPTPWASTVARRTGGRLVAFTGGGHGLVAGGDPSAIGIAAAFFDSPSQRPDTTCARANDPPLP